MLPWLMQQHHPHDILFFLSLCQPLAFADLAALSTSIGGPRTRKYANEDIHGDRWAKHKKHAFVLSNAGKPIYARYGDESKLAPFTGVLSAIVSFVDDVDDNIRFISAGGHKFVFLVKGPIYVVIVAKT